MAGSVATIAVADAINPDVKTLDIPITADVSDSVFSAFAAGTIASVPGRFLWPPPAALLAEQPAPAPHSRQQLPSVEEEVGTVPLFDLSELITGSAGARKKLAREMGAAARDWGFFQIVNHGMAPRLLDDLQASARRLFALPFEQKLAGSFPPDGSTLGYRVGGVPNRKNSKLFLWQQNLTVWNQPEAIRDYSSRIWQDPARAAAFSALLEEYVQSVERVAQRVVELLVEDLGGDGEEVNRRCGGPTSFTTMRLNYYPNCPEPSKTIGVVPHSDPSVISVLHQDEVGGLEILKDGRWVRVEPVPGAFVVNIGDLLQAMSNNVYPSVLHRAQVHPVKHRLSMVLFYAPHRDATVEPLPQVVDAEHPPIYRPFGYEEYLAVFKTKQMKNGTHLTRFRADYVEDPVTTQ